MRRQYRRSAAISQLIPTRRWQIQLATTEADVSRQDAIVTIAEVQPLPPALSDSPSPGLTEADARIQSSVKQMNVNEETAASNMMPPVSAEGEEESKLPTSTSNYFSCPSMGHDFCNIRVLVHSLQLPAPLGLSQSVDRVNLAVFPENPFDRVLIRIINSN